MTEVKVGVRNLGWDFIAKGLGIDLEKGLGNKGPPTSTYLAELDVPVDGGFPRHTEDGHKERVA